MRKLNHLLLFLFLCLLVFKHSSAQSFSDSLEQRILKAQSEGRIIDNLNNSFSQYPKGEFLLAPSNKNLNFGILIYNIDIYAEKAVFSAGLAFRDPKSNQLIAFRADNISFSNTNGLAGPVKLLLIQDIIFNLGKAAEINIEANNNQTYAIFNCNGIEAFGISGEVVFNSDFILPVNNLGEVEAASKCTAKFKCHAKSWSDIVVQISLNPFQVKGLVGYVFNINNVVMDLSESFNANEMVFPLGYNFSEFYGINGLIWEGFFLKSGSVTFPKHFRSEGQTRIELGVKDLLIDEFGFSGKIFGNNLLDFEKGKISNWNLSIEQVEITVVMNEIVKGEMSGSVGMPILPDTTKLGYKAYINPNDNYGMLVSVSNTLTIPALKIAKVELTTNSYIDIEILDGVILLNAELNGNFLVENKSSNGVAFNFPSITFQGFHVANTEPKIDIQYLGLNSNSSATHLSSYPVNINRIYFQKLGNDKCIGINVSMNLMERISVKAGVLIYSELQSERLKFKNIQLSEIELKSVTSCFSLEGKLSFIKADPVFGNGLSGAIKFSIDKPRIASSATILFGTINNHRYWYFDASVLWENPGLPVFTGAEMNGFMGGAWNGMREASSKDLVSNLSYGNMSNGKIYLPDPQSGLGLKAAVYVKGTGGSGNSSPFVASVLLEMQFNKNNGLNRVEMLGNIDLMTENNKPEKTVLKQSVTKVQGLSLWDQYKLNYMPKGKIGGPILLEFDFINKIYQANFAVFLQGIANDKIKGRGLNGLAGEASAYFSPTKWYVWIGTPLQPVNIGIDLGAAGNASLSAYFMAGTEVKSAAPLPYEITASLGEKSSDGMRNLSAMAEGSAFAFGSRFNLMVGSTGGESNVSIYASLRAIIGFDINVSNYGKNTTCANRSGTPGINGWFANGQLFAFLQGKVGASYKVGSLTGKVDLLTLTFASQLYCQGPNPFYSKGAAAVQVNIGGVINKKMKLSFEFGESCEMKRNSFTDTALILETNIVGGEKNISTCLPLKTKFSVPIDKSFTDVEGRRVAFRLTKYEVSESGKQILGKLIWNKEQNNLSFHPDNLYPGNKLIKITISVEAASINSNYLLQNADGSKCSQPLKDQSKWNELVSKMKLMDINKMDFGNGKYIVRVDNYETILLNGRKVEEVKLITFNTAKNPNNIPSSNIASAYPIPGQLNYYNNMSPTGFVNLITAQDYLLRLEGTKVVALFVDSKGKVVAEGKVSLKGKRIQFTMPEKILLKNEVYMLKLKRTAINAVSFIGKNIYTSTDKANSTSASYSSTGNGALTDIGNIKTNTTIVDLDLCSYSFGVSKFSSFCDKIKSLELKQQTVFQDDIFETKLVNTEDEYFDNYEFKINGMKKPLELVLDLKQMPWFVNSIKKIYSIYGSKNMQLLNELQLNRDTSVMGLIPSAALLLSEENLNGLVLQKTKTGVVKPAYSKEGALLVNSVYEIICNDFQDIKNGLIQYVSANDNFNLKEVSKYITLLNSYNSNSPTNFINVNSNLNSGSTFSGGGTVKVLSPGFQSAIPMVQNNTVTSSNIKTKNDLLMKIAKLKVPEISDYMVWPVIFKYFIPEETKPISSCVLKINSVK